MDNAPHAKKSLGQHWLTDPFSLDCMVESADISENDSVLEIGPGYGTLTERLLATGANVTALEFDQSLLAGLSQRFADNPNFTLLHGDIRTFNFDTLPTNYKVVANIPYYLTSHLIQLLSEAKNRPAVAALLIQKEVAERVAAKPGNMSLLSVTAQYYWNVQLDAVVPAALFTPPPKVDSQILVLHRLQAKASIVSDKAYFRVVKAGFSQKRKTLLNSLSGGLAIAREAAEQLLNDAGVESTRRAQTLSLEEWADLAQAHQTAGHAD